MKIKLFKDILKEKAKYSQGRVYLFISVLAYYFVNLFVVWKTVKCGIETFDTEPLELVMEALKWSMALFAGYVFGGKGVEVLKLLVNSKFDKKNNPSNEPSEEELI